MLLFRDWLRTNEADRQLSERTKRGLAGRTWKYTQNYADAKSELVEEILARAAAHAREQDHGSDVENGTDLTDL